MTKQIVKLDEHGHIVYETDDRGNRRPILEEVSDATPVKMVNGFLARLDDDERKDLQERQSAAKARAERSEAQRIEEDVLPAAPFNRDPVQRATIKALLSFLPTPPTEAEFNAKVKEMLMAEDSGT